MDEHQLFLDYLKELQKETPRGAVIISCVVIQEVLGKTLENYLTDHKDVKTLLNGGMAPLGTLSARILLCFGLRLVDEKEYKNLQIVRRIRNHFAHDLHASFEDQKIIDLCKQLDASGLRPESMPTPARRYNAVVTLLLVLLTKKPMASVGRRIGEVGWEDRVRKQLKKVFSEESKAKRLTKMARASSD